MKRVVVLFAILFLFSSVSAIKITEVELNPSGTDAGHEWVELSSGTEVNLSEYKLVNNDGGEVMLSGNFLGYYVYIFENQWLDNSDEKVFLYKNSELIDETTILSDSKNNDETWQTCDNSWEFKLFTKELKNECDTEEEPEEDDSQENVADESEDERQDNDNEDEGPEEIKTTLEVEEEKPVQIIQLNPKDIKSGGDTFNLDKSDFAIYGFVIFCILILLLFILKKNKYKKNEFR